MILLDFCNSACKPNEILSPNFVVCPIEVADKIMNTKNNSLFLIKILKVILYFSITKTVLNLKEGGFGLFIKTTGVAQN